MRTLAEVRRQARTGFALVELTEYFSRLRKAMKVADCDQESGGRLFGSVQVAGLRRCISKEISLGITRARAGRLLQTKAHLTCKTPVSDCASARLVAETMARKMGLGKTEMGSQSLVLNMTSFGWLCSKKGALK